MTITPEELAVLMQEVEVADPIDFADLPFDEQELRGLIANHLCEMADAMESFSPEDRNLALLAVAAKLVLENLVLHVQLLRHTACPSATAWTRCCSASRAASPPESGAVQAAGGYCRLMAVKTMLPPGRSVPWRMYSTPWRDNARLPPCGKSRQSCGWPGRSHRYCCARQQTADCR